MTNVLLYAVTVLVWGTSWFAIKFQLGVVAPEASLVYRFVLSAAVMMAFCVLMRRPMRFRRRDHAIMAVQGLFLFSTNFFLIYLGSQYLASGLVAVVFSTLVVMNIAGATILFGQPLTPRVAAGAGVGVVGIAIVFWPEIAAFEATDAGVRGLGLVLAGTLSASLGMLISGANQRRGLPVVQTNAYGMVYGAGFLSLLTLVRGSGFAFEATFAYMASLFYLAVFASVIGFWTYLTLLGRIGAGRAGYTAVLFPVIALGLSTAFEGYSWSSASITGIALVLLGNTLILVRRPPPGA